jgi:predicted metal-dependent phosphoesterase TrpH
VVHRTGPSGQERVVPPAPATIDLHTHTSRSDGVHEPSDVLAAAAAAGNRTLSITDHDTLAGYRELAAGAGTPNLELIAGVEINSVVDGDDGMREGELHVLGYGVDAESDEFEALLAAQRGQRRRRYQLALDRLRELGMPVDALSETLVFHDETALGRPTLARLLVQAGFAESVDDAFRRILSSGRPGYVPRQGIGPRAAIRAITAAGGLASLAHFGEAPKRADMLRELKDIGVRGLEVYYRGFWAETVTALEGTARRLGLVATGGTDYHGDRESYAEAHAALWVPQQVADELHAALTTPAGSPLVMDSP